MDQDETEDAYAPFQQHENNSPTSISSPVLFSTQQPRYFFIRGESSSSSSSSMSSPVIVSGTSPNSSPSKKNNLIPHSTSSQLAALADCHFDSTGDMTNHVTLCESFQKTEITQVFLQHRTIFFHYSCRARQCIIELGASEVIKGEITGFQYRSFIQLGEKKKLERRDIQDEPELSTSEAFDQGSFVGIADGFGAFLKFVGPNTLCFSLNDLSKDSFGSSMFGNEMKFLRRAFESNRISVINIKVGILWIHDCCCFQTSNWISKKFVKECQNLPIEPSLADCFSIFEMQLDQSRKLTNKTMDMVYNAFSILHKCIQPSVDKVTGLPKSENFSVKETNQNKERIKKIPKSVKSLQKENIHSNSTKHWEDTSNISLASRQKLRKKKKQSNNDQHHNTNTIKKVRKKKRVPLKLLPLVSSQIEKNGNADNNDSVHQECQSALESMNSSDKMRLIYYFQTSSVSTLESIFSFQQSIARMIITMRPITSFNDLVTKCKSIACIGTRTILEAHKKLCNNAKLTHP